MSRRGPLHLYQEVMLLALEDRKGTLLWNTHYPQALGGALMAELLLAGRLALEQEKKKTFVRVADDRPLGDELLDEALAKVAGAKRRQQLGTWVPRFAALKRLTARAALGLVRLGILKESEQRVLLLFHRRVYPEVDPRPEKDLAERLRRAIASPHQAEPRTLVLLALAYHANLLGGLLPKGELKRRRKDIERAIEKLPAGKATKEAIAAAQAAVMVAILMPAMMASTTATH